MSFLRKKPKADTPKSVHEAEQEQGHRHDSQLPPINGGRFSEETHQHLEDLKSGQNNILVAVRARPLSTREVSFSNFETVRILDGKVVALLDPGNQFESNDIFRNNRNKEKQYAFDMAFDHSVNTPTVFENTTKILIPGILNGFNATIFAYGATGAGKTHTMLGNPNTPGIMYLTMNELFTQIKSYSQNKDLTVKISYLEVYNETLRDLLSEEENIVDLREDSKGIVIAGITEILTDSAEEVMELLRLGSKNRIMEPTAANTVSSRSHAVLQVTVEQKDKHQGIKEEGTVSKLSLIDLAGSERASNTNNKGQRMIEGANINKSLLALGNCITLLSEQMEKGVKVLHIPYRDSKLTRLLKDSLGGNCRTIMIANISPSVIAFEDTLNTLKYANRAKSIKTSVSRNVLSVEKHMDQYTNIISGLKQENEQLKRLLQGNHKMENIERNVGKEANFSINDGLIKDIKKHFDEEMKIKKKIFDLDMQSDDLQEKIMLMQYETDVQEDKASKDRHQEYINMQKRIAPQVEELKKEFTQLISKRSQLQSKIQSEKSKDGVSYLTSIFQQNEMIIENMDLHHKERRAENEVRLKDKQIRYLENQLGIKGGPSNRGRLKSLTPPPHLDNDFNSYHKGDPMDFLHRLNDIDNNLNISSAKALNSPHQALYLPHISPKGGYAAHARPSRNMPMKKLGLKNLHDRMNPPSVRKVGTPQEGQYYYNKHDFMVQKAKAFDPKSVLPGRKKNSMVTRHVRQKINYGERFRSFDAAEDKSGRNSARSKESSVEKVMHKRNAGSLTDLGPEKVAQDKKKNLLAGLNKRNKVGGKITPMAKLIAEKPHIQIPMTTDNQHNSKGK